MLVLLHGKSGWVRVVPDPYGGSEAPATSSELPFLKDTWRLRTYPTRGMGPGPFAWWGKSLTRGAWLLRPLEVVTNNYTGPALLQ